MGSEEEVDIEPKRRVVGWGGSLVLSNVLTTIKCTDAFSSSPNSPIPVNYIAGVLGGVTVTFVGHPFDTVKVRLQTQPTGRDALYTNTLDCVKKTYKGEGFSGFYAGVGSPLMGQMFFRAGSFAAFHEVHSVVQGNFEGLGKYEKVRSLLGGGGGIWPH